ncbi:UNVERIFIED_CONTAM: hypothetical protein FKN15_056779 [Acipenser sinensis]
MNAETYRDIQSESEEGQPREREVPPPATDKGEEVRSPPPPQPRPPPLRSGPALLQVIPCPLLLDTLPVCLDLPALDLELRSVHHRPQLYPWFPSPLSLITQTSLGCCQTSLVLPLLAAKLPLCDRTSLRRAPGEDLCLRLHPPVPRPSLRSPLSSQWGPVSPVHGPTLEVPEGPTHPQARPWIRAKIKICGLEGLLERGKRTTVSAGRITYGGSKCGRPYDPEKMESIEELIARINQNTAAQLEQTERWEREMGLAPLEAREREPTELELLLQKWEQAREAPLSADPAREAPRSPAPEDVVLCPEREESFPESEEGQPREREVLSITIAKEQITGATSPKYPPSRLLSVVWPIMSPPIRD